ncbi:2,3-bisphosphoglycerate-independent phosphoglycerate mutase [Candidatus Woesearchaeota archaeon]|jgi:2,3-bisphosphoglycerate-independent phosphoglycerate mutase|nr:2,3-bisphosphoglycerate-independent phosphoglycerate mutase [Candidatus Woesearchaeota archaeon]MBT4368746.1 2,3-bisphosphoglycerate-independent phosphoglycerate mutase [Candidatus Woesearchaeota archaeon]MBT4712035.1 2,3-bisphosphoglycerate-independent phosphoglycerate mutase [Candidatus Woesearchaeota archaeon]MBT6639217.1 2,3-bisphosphoglycerate-independent phosphoglycerate mutase [Candidatus Woesearchaeota archaeon]MBT7134417.1 2,3-bisphosphoglycerate-independent phosphoglycerate mutase 
MKPVVLVILDGWGISKYKKGNALKAGKTPFITKLRKTDPTSKLKCFGQYVGLPKGFQGNSEVGHINIGAGRIVSQMLEIINKKIKDKSFFHDKQILQAIKNCKKYNSTLHLMGMLSDKGVHSHQAHLFALLKLAKQHNLTDVKIHVFTDGRDCLPKSALTYISQLNNQLKSFPGEIATISGRYYAMDRDKRWNRTEKAYNAIINARGKHDSTPKKAVQSSYKKGITDEFILPTVLNGYNGVNKKDSLIFFNYRLDRARQLTHAITDTFFKHFKRRKVKLFFTAFTPYYKGILGKIAFREPKIPNNLGAVLAKHRLKQFRIAETEKYAHVTFFFNSEKEKPFKRETRYIIPSPKVATYDLKPEMSANKITKKLVSVINNDFYDVIIVNYANADMVGHTGKLNAALKAVNTVDSCVKQVVEAVKKQNGTTIIAADHGNCEEMIEPKTNKVCTSHSLNPVYCTIVSQNVKRLRDGVLADIAPTLLEILKIKKPKQMTGKSLIMG